MGKNKDYRHAGRPRKKIVNLLKIWRIARGLTGGELRRMQAKSVNVSVAGSAQNREALKARLAPTGSSISEYESMQDAARNGEKFTLDADSLDIQTTVGLGRALNSIARRDPSARIALAAKYPAMRPYITEQLTREVSRSNARIAAFSALPGVIPLTDWLMPAASAGDILLLTRNQINLLLEISACYGLPPDPRARLTELVPVVGAAFGWRAIARELVGLVPAGIGVGIKAGVAYAGTYAVGKAADAYYAGCKPVDMRQLYGTALRHVIAEGKNILRRPPSKAAFKSAPAR
jgi:uncharacterized protein (DUF697 family)